MQNVCVRSGPYMYIPKWLPICIRSGVFQPYALAHSNHIVTDWIIPNIYLRSASFLIIRLWTGTFQQIVYDSVIPTFHLQSFVYNMFMRLFIPIVCLWWGVFQPCAYLVHIFTFEPPHDKTNKMTVRPANTQINLGICPVWSESSLCAQWVAKDGQRRLWSGWSESSLGEHAILLVLSWGGSILIWDLNIVYLTHMTDTTLNKQLILIVFQCFIHSNSFGFCFFFRFFFHLLLHVLVIVTRALTHVLPFFSWYLSVWVEVIYLFPLTEQDI